jgi:hypothetical protein
MARRSKAVAAAALWEIKRVMCRNEDNAFPNFTSYTS